MSYILLYQESLNGNPFISLKTFGTEVECYEELMAHRGFERTERFLERFEIFLSTNEEHFIVKSDIGDYTELGYNKRKFLPKIERYKELYRDKLLNELNI